MLTFFQDPEHTTTSSSCRQTKRGQFALAAFGDAIPLPYIDIAYPVILAFMSVYSFTKEDTSRLDRTIHFFVFLCALIQFGSIVTSLALNEDCSSKTGEFSSDTVFCDINYTAYIINLSLLGGSAFRDDIAKRNGLDYNPKKTNQEAASENLVLNDSDDEEENNEIALGNV